MSYQSNQLKGVQKISSPNSCRKSNIQYIPSRTSVKLQCIQRRFNLNGSSDSIFCRVSTTSLMPCQFDFYLLFFGLCFYFFYGSFPFSFGSWKKWIQNLMIFIQHLNYLSIITILVAWLESFWPNHIWWTTCSLLETFIREP